MVAMLHLMGARKEGSTQQGDSPFRSPLGEERRLSTLRGLLTWPPAILWCLSYRTHAQSDSDDSPPIYLFK